MPIDFSLLILLIAVVFLSVGYLQPWILSQAIRVVLGQTVHLSYTQRLSVVLGGLAGSLIVYTVIPGAASLGGIVAKFFILRSYIPRRDQDVMFVIAADVAIGIAIGLGVLGLVGSYMFVGVQMGWIDQAWLMQQWQYINTL